MRSVLIDGNTTTYHGGFFLFISCRFGGYATLTQSVASHTPFRLAAGLGRWQCYNRTGRCCLFPRTLSAYSVWRARMATFVHAAI